MKLKYIPLSKRSEKKKLRDAIGKLDFEILKIKRGNKCEIHNKPCANLGRMHILPISKYPRLEFTEINIILAGWYCSHFYFHHNSDNPRAIEAKKRILELRGHTNWEDLLTELKILHETMPRHTKFYLQLLYHAKQRELEELTKCKDIRY